MSIQFNPLTGKLYENAGEGAVVNVDDLTGDVEGIIGASGRESKIPRTIGPNPSKHVKIFGLPEESAGIRGYTLRTTYKRSKPFYAVRFYFIHPTTTPVTGCIANFTTSNSCANPNIPGNPSWKNITMGGSTALTITPGIGTKLGISVSDVMPCTPQVRVDGGDGYLLEVGVTIPVAGNTVGLRIGGVKDAAIPSQTVDTYMIQSGAHNGDSVTNPAAFFRHSNDLGAWVAVEFFEGASDQNEKVLLACGDSITQGLDTPRVHYGAAHIAAQATGSVLYNAGLLGKGRNVYLDFGLDRLSVVRPDYAFLAPWSPNDADAFTAGVAEAVLSNAAQWVSACHAVGAIPILATPTPKTGITAPQEAVRRGVVQYVKEFCATNNILMVDRDAIYTDYSSATGGFKAGLGGDPLHPNLAGYTLESQLWIPLIR